MARIQIDDLPLLLVPPAVAEASAFVEEFWKIDSLTIDGRGKEKRGGGDAEGGRFDLEAVADEAVGDVIV